MHLLKLIRTQSAGSVAISQLATQSGLYADNFQDALKALVDSGFVEVNGSPLEATISLTPKGSDVAKLV